MICDWARRLIASEADAGTPSQQTHAATLRVYQKLRRQLCAPVGVDGFQALASRALALAKSQSPRLSVVEITAAGGLRGLGDVEFRTDSDENGEVGIILIAQLLGLFLTFLGEATTLRLMEDLRLQAEDVRLQTGNQTELATAAEATPATGASYFGPFENIMLEADQLRKVSTRLEILADTHEDLEEGLVSVAGNIRNIATVLDVFTLIRSKAGGAQEDAPNPQTNGYLN
jgi:hypothetical protein